MAAMVAKKFARKLSRSRVEAVLLVHMVLACVVLGSEREPFTRKIKKRTRIKSEQLDIKVGRKIFITKTDIKF